MTWSITDAEAVTAAPPASTSMVNSSRGSVTPARSAMPTSRFELEPGMPVTVVAMDGYEMTYDAAGLMGTDDGLAADVPVAADAVCPPDLSGMRVGVPEECFEEGLDPEVGELVGAAIELAKELGAAVGARTYSKDFELEADRLHRIREGASEAEVVREWASRHPDPAN